MVRLLVQHEAFDTQHALSLWGDDRYQYVDAAVAEGHQTILAFLLSSRQPHHNNWTTWLGIADSYDQVGSRRTLEDAMSRISTLLPPQRRSTITLKSGRVNIASKIIEDYPQEASPEHRARLAIELNRATTFCHILGEGSMKEESLGRLADLAVELDSSAIFDRILIQMLLTPVLSRDLATKAVMYNRQDYLPRLFEQIRPKQSALAELAQLAAKLERGPSFCAYVNHSMLEEECVETLVNLLEAHGRDELGSVYDLITEYTNLENLWALASYAFKTRQTKTTAAVQLFRRLNPSDLLFRPRTYSSLKESQEVSATQFAHLFHLKRALYLSPCEIDDLDPTLHSFEARVYVNSVLKKPFTPSADYERTMVTFNPLLYEEVGYTDPSSPQRRGFLRSDILLSSAERLSCDDMYFTQRPWEASCDTLAEARDPFSMRDPDERYDYFQKIQRDGDLMGMKFGEIRLKAMSTMEHV
ncbi:hypothetical protein Slin14017_G087970 [Septoria linicola]|nr:hypothetical protein Slin14017_G087970 [Septoria linicola]